ncbi:MAG: hypothetical protein IEMM0008_1379 [bacterium]|nr:MAG: hypothetical protein IEMM0008_1379 [bacterium]
MIGWNSKSAKNKLINIQMNRLPKSPGVYLMKNRLNEIIYIGKAKNIYSRVRSYFYKSRKQSPKTKNLVEELVHIDFKQTPTELEALILESRLIKSLLPKYNRLLKQYKNYPFIKVNLKNEFPRVYMTQDCPDDGNYYFGPFNNTYSLVEDIHLINKIFKSRTCSHNIKVDPMDHSCLYGQIDQCEAPCNGSVTKNKYKKLVNEIIHFLEQGESDVIKNYLKQTCEKKKDLVTKQLFEQAHKIQRDQNRLNHIIQQNRLLNDARQYTNSLLLLRENNSHFAFHIREGRIQNTYPLDQPSDLIESLDAFVDQYHDPPTGLLPGMESTNYSPDILSKKCLDEMKIIIRWIRSDHGNHLIIPSKKINSFLTYLKSNAIQQLSDIYSLAPHYSKS